MPVELPDRKYLLMQRDPLVDEYVKKWNQWRSNCFDETLTKETEQLAEKVRKKWNATIYWPETTKQGMSDFWFLTSPVYVGVRDERESARREEHLLINEDGKITLLKYRGLVSCNPHEIPIIIDPTILTSKDAQAVKKAVWKIVESEIGKQNKIIRGRNFAAPAKEPEALAAVSHCKPKIFEKYLRWYDQWERELYLRCITYVEMKVTDAKNRDELFEKYAKANKKPQTITSSMPNDLACAIERKENAVRKGVDIIYFAIHRKERTSKASSTKSTHNIRKLNCPNHPEIDGKPQCPLDCPYLIAYLQDFEKDFEKDMPSELPWVSQRVCLDILGDSGDFIKMGEKYTMANRNDDIEESEE